jgi:hypothetical protein
MQRIVFIVLGLLCSVSLQSQVVFKAIVSRQVVTVGESFQIQYLMDHNEKDIQFTPPPFKGFRVASGPYTYTGSINEDGSPPLKNIVFTLESLKPGRFIIPGARARVKGRQIRSDDIIIDVLTQKQAIERATRKREVDDPSDYFLRPGEDPYEKMRKNLFMKVMVDRKNCYVGQPVVATFKLYSRLESKSDIVKNPGFYGFTVQDIVNLADNIARTETISGKAFDVHTIRIVQLYPLSEGIFTIDPMEVTNKVEFSKSVVNKKPEQEIIEGVVENKDLPSKPNTVTYENHISTEKIEIRVKPYPAARKPVLFNGATGKFVVESAPEKNELARNEKGMLVVRIIGKGNFTQLPTPKVQWPAGIEGFEPAMVDSLDKTQVPLKGSRTFRFPFVSNNAGDYSIPSISFSFFDPDSNNYKTATSNSAEIRIGSEEKRETLIEQKKVSDADKKDNSTIWLYATIFCVVMLIILLQLKKSRKEEIVKQKVPDLAETNVSMVDLLKPVQFSLVADDGNFYTLLQKSIWEHLGTQLKLSGSKMNKDELYKVMREGNREELYREILDVLQECEAAVFTKAEMMRDKEELLDKARLVLGQIKA